MRTFARLLLLGAAAGCGESKPAGPPKPLCSSAMPKGSIAVPDEMGLAGPGKELGASICTEVDIAPTLEAAGGDIVPAGYVALGRAVRFAGRAAPLPHGIDFVLPADLGKGPKDAAPSRIVVAEKRANGQVVVTPVTNVVYEADHKRLHFHGDELATYQAAVPESAGKMVSRRYTYRAIGGVSMGGMGSSVNFWTRPERYDALIVMGADPGPDLTYTLGMMQDWFFAGFCTADDEKAGKGKVGELCAPARKPMADQHELSMDFEHLLYQKGDGVGLTLRRRLYVRAFRDLSRALGNGAYATAMGASTYLPPGVPPAALDVPNADFCSKPVILKNFFDGKYNPDGARDVITFCDGGDGAKLGFGVFDPAEPQNDPTQILLAVDVNGNGKRDQGEPVVLQGGEPFRDVGPDGKASKDEPGYDPVTNPDPAGDDFHWMHNPGGQENNWRYDMGEPFDDFGVDGVQGKGCPVGSAPGCYDFGEGNKEYDYNLNTRNWYAHDPRTRIEALPPAELERLAIYYDAGIRDFLNAHVSTNSLAAALHHRGAHVRVWDGFPLLVGLRQSEGQKFDVTTVDFAPLGRRVYVRYGDPDASPAFVESTGEGRHVGTVLQATHRAQMLFYFLSNVWPDPDQDVPDDIGPGRQLDETFTTKNGRKTPYSVVLPPGYDDAQNASKRYPVVYLLHGYGMDPMGLAAVAVIGSSAMVNTSVAPERRIQKFIVVLVDGACRPGGDIPSDGPLPKVGDLCEQGTFYTDHPEGTGAMETHLLELQELVEARFRVKLPEERMVRQ